MRVWLRVTLKSRRRSLLQGQAGALRGPDWKSIGVTESWSPGTRPRASIGQADKGSRAVAAVAAAFTFKGEGANGWRNRYRFSLSVKSQVVRQCLPRSLGSVRGTSGSTVHSVSRSTRSASSPRGAGRFGGGSGSCKRRIMSGSVPRVMWQSRPGKGKRSWLR